MVQNKWTKNGCKRFCWQRMHTYVHLSIYRLCKRLIVVVRERTECAFCYNQLTAVYSFQFGSVQLLWLFFVTLDTAVNCWKKSYPHHQYSSCKAMANINADASTDINWAEIHYLLLLCEHLYSQNYGPIYCNNIYRSVFFFLSLCFTRTHPCIHIHFHSFCLISCVCTNIITNTILIN